MLENLLHGLTALGGGSAIAYLVGGALIGMFLGVIPGLGGPVVLSIILAFVYHIDLTGTLCLFLGTHAGSYFSASVTSILLNTPAHPEAFAVTFDGFPMAQRGEAGRALGISATSTCIGGFIGCAVLVGFIQIISDLPNLFHPPEYVALVLIAMLLVGTLGTDQVSKAIISAGIGLMCASVGASVITGVFRYSFGAVGLYSGISLVALTLGTFAIPQMVMVFGSGTTVARQDMTGREVKATEAVGLSRGFGRQVIGGIVETLHHRGLLLMSALIGVVTGIIPGIGGFAANFMSYGVAQQTSKRREMFGTGIPEGIIAPEGSSLSKEAGGLVPILALGIPGGVGGALLLAALAIKDIQVGYGFSGRYPTLPYEMVWIIALAGLIGTAAGVLVAPLLAKVTKVPGPVLVPFVMALAVLGTFVADLSFFEVMEVLVFGILGLALRRLRYSLGAFVIGLVLGPTFETNIYLTHNVYKGVSFVSERPFADVLFLIAIGVLVLKTVQIRRDKKLEIAAYATEVAQLDDILMRGEAIRAQQRKRNPYPLLAPMTTVFLVAVSIFWIVYGSLSYSFVTAVMPVIAGALVAGPALYRLPRDIHGYVLYRREKNRNASAPGGEVVVGREVVPTGASAQVSTGNHVMSFSTPADLVEAMGPAPITTSDHFAPIEFKAWGRHGQYSRELLAYAWLMALILACYVFGFQWGVPAFVAAYGLTCTRRIFVTLRGRILFSAIGAAVMWFAAYEMFHLVHVTFTPVIRL